MIVARAKGVKTYKHSAVKAIILVAVLGFCVYMAIQLSRNVSPQVSTQRTQTVTDSTYAYLEGYIFRDEDTLAINPGAVVDYAFGNGEKVGVEQAFAKVYYPSGLDAAALEQKQTELSELSARIGMIEAGLGQSFGNADLSAISKDISKYYYSYVNLVNNGDLRAADEVGERLLSAMVEYSTGTGGEEAKSVIGQLKAEKDQLLSTLGASSTLVSDEGFNLLYSSDGYEEIFHSDKLDGLTPDQLKALADSQPKQQSGTVVCRRIYTPKWYIAIPVDEATYLGFTEGAVYDVTFPDSNGVVVDMTLERICIDEDDVANAYLLFSSYDLAHAQSMTRTQSVRIYLGSCSGYRVPKQALYDGEQYDYVYVLVGNTVELRRVTVKGEGNGYYIVNTYEEDLAENVPVDTPYLEINDMLITSGNDLYDGKLLD